MSGPSSVLIVDDEQHIRMYLKLLLKKIGFTEFHEATNGNEAIAMYDLEKPDLVLMDVNMPVKEGIEALEEILESDEDAVVVMMTSVASRNTVEASAKMGAAHYIRKDTPKDEIASQLEELIEDIWSDE